MTANIDKWLGGASVVDTGTYIVAEVANAHEGDPEHALRLIEALVGSGVDAVKFQIFTAEELTVPEHPMRGVFRGLEMSELSWERVAAATAASGLDLLVDVFGHESAKLARTLRPSAFKVHSSDVGNHPLLRDLGRDERPILLSTGGTTPLEVSEALRSLRDAGSERIILMHGIQRFPTRIEDTFLSRMSFLRERFGLPLGFADHVAGGSPESYWLPLMGLGAGATLIEKHVTLDRSLAGTDHHSALEPPELAAWVKSVRLAEKALGTPREQLTESEAAYRKAMKKRPVATRDLPAGTVVGPADITLRRVEDARGSVRPEDLIGRKLKVSVHKDSPMDMSIVKNRVYAVLACRNESTRLYGKPFQLIGDRPILGHLVDRLRTCRRIDGIVLALSDGPHNLGFKEFAEAESLDVIVGSEQDVLKRLIQGADHVGADVIVRVTTENPYIYHEHIDSLIERHEERGADLTVMELLPVGAHAEVINVSALKRAHENGEDRHRSELCTLFLFENADSFAIEKLSAPKSVAQPDLRLTVDTPEDLMFVRQIYDALAGDHGHLVPLNEIVAYAEANPELCTVNEHLSGMRLWR